MISKLFQEIETAYPSITGWCSLQRAEELAAMIIGLHPATTCIIGVWGGKDTIPMAMAHRALGAGKVLAIDPWSAPSSVHGQDKANSDWWGNQQMHDSVYQGFIHALALFGLNDWVEVRREPSDAVTPPAQIDLLLVDGNHGPQAVKDVQRYAPSVPVGGIVYLDDLKWQGGAVEQAEQVLLAMGFERMFSRDTGAFFQRVR